MRGAWTGIYLRKVRKLNIRKILQSWGRNFGHKIRLVYRREFSRKLLRGLYILQPVDAFMEILLLFLKYGHLGLLPNRYTVRGLERVLTFIIKPENASAGFFEHRSFFKFEHFAFIFLEIFQLFDSFHGFGTQLILHKLNALASFSD